MMTLSDFNMLRLDAHRDMLQITAGTTLQEQAVELASPALWVRTIVQQQKQVENDLKQLTDLDDNTIDRTDQCIQ